MYKTMNRTARIAFLSIMLLAFALRVHGLDSESLWIDEGYSISLAEHSPWDVIQGTAADQHPPLYYLLLHAWLRTGKSVFQVRFLSVICGLLSVALVGWLAKMLGGPWTGVISAGLIAISPIHIWYSQEARMYILLCALGILSTGLAIKLIRGKVTRGTWIAYLLSTIATIYTQNFGFFLILFQNIVAVLWLWRRRSLAKWLSWIAGQAVVLLAYLPWLPTVIYQTRYHRMTWVGIPTWPQLRDTVVYLATGVERNDTWVYFAAMAWTMVALLGLAIAIGRSKKDQRQAIILATMWWMLPITTIFLVSQRYPVFQAKQMLIFVPGIWLSASIAIQQLPRKLIAIPLVAFAFFACVSLPDMYTLPQKHGWREAAHFINENQQPTDALFMNPAAGAATLGQYLEKTLPTAGYPPEYDIVQGGWSGEQVSTDIAANSLEPLAAKHQRIWLIEFSPGFWDPEGQLAGWLNNHGQTVFDSDFGGIHVTLYEIAATLQ